MHLQRNVTVEGKMGVGWRERAFRIIRNYEIIHPVVLYLLKRKFYLNNTLNFS